MTKKIPTLLAVRVLFVAVIFLVPAAVLAQTAKHPALPPNLAKYVGKYPADLMKVPAVRSRLRALLGRSYSEFDNATGVQHEIEKKGDFLLAAGCTPHLCASIQAAFVIDLKNKRIHAVIYDEDEAPRYFNEDKAATPKVLLEWVAGLKGT